MILLNWLTSAISVMLVSYIVPGFHVGTFGTALFVALVLGLLNATARPLLIIITLPITILSLGLWLLIINAGMLLLVDRMFRTFTIDSFLAAVLGSIVLTLISWSASQVFGNKK